MNDDRRGEAPLEGAMKAMADAYNRPPPVPRDAMWAAIEERIAREAARRRGARLATLRRRVLGWGAVAAAASAVLALGVGIGQRTGPGAEVRLAAPSTEAGAEPVRRAAAEHLGRSEELLTLVRADARAGRIDPAVGVWGRDLLVETRLLLDSDAGEDPALRMLLEDLELILAQVALLAGEGMDDEGRAREEMEILARGLDDTDVLPRIQAVVPEVPGLTGT